MNHYHGIYVAFCNASKKISKSTS